MKINSKILHPELSYIITGICFQVQRDLGRFCRERQYADRFEELLKEKELRYRREIDLRKINENSIAGNICDFVVEEKIVIDCKAKKFITKEDYFQMLRYLKSSNLELGMIVNFRSTFLKPKRVLNNELNTHE